MVRLNEIYNEDCLQGMKSIPDESVDCIVTDPPYRLTSRGGSGTMSGYLVTDLSRKGKVFENNNIDIQDYIDELYRVLKDRTHCYIMCNQLNLPHFLQVISNSKFKYVKCLVWDKGNKICGRFYMNCFEYIIMLRKGGERPINNCGSPDLLRYPNKKTKDANGKNIHDSEKPVDLMEVLISNSTNPGDTILDPFMGSGTTAVGAIRAKRNYIGFELQKEYCDAARERIHREMLGDMY